MSLHHDPFWPRASAWLEGDFRPEAERRLGVVGLPSGLGSITPGRCDLAPAAVRKALARFSQFDIATPANLARLAVQDFGDAAIADLSIEAAFPAASTAVQAAVSATDAIVILGGDNSITRPGVHGLGVPLERVGLITIDAHLDLRDVSNGLSNGNPIHALLLDGLPGGQIWQIGIQSFANSAAYAGLAEQAGIHFVPMREVHARSLEFVLNCALDDLNKCVDAIYIDLDLDVMDRVFAPGCPGSRPGGLTPNDIIQASRMAGECPRVRAMDLVELDPTLDVNDATTMTAAMCLLSFAGGVLSRESA